MFGYVTAYKPELKVKEYETYKGVYCTLCKEMGKEYGVLSRFLLSYDGAFYVIYKLGLSGEEVTAAESHCTFNPCKKCCKISCAGDTYKLAAAITVILAYFKLIDNINDGSFFKKITLTLIRPYFAFLKKRAEKRYPEIVNVVSKGMKKQLFAEQEKDVSVDKAADASAEMLGFLFSYGEEGEEAQNAERFGYLLGRAVYFLDAFDDYNDDMKTGSFNPFKNSGAFLEEAALAVNLTIGELISVRQKQSFNKFNEIVDNIIYDGLNYQLQKIIKKYKGDNFEQSV